MSWGQPTVFWLNFTLTTVEGIVNMAHNFICFGENMKDYFAPRI